MAKSVVWTSIIFGLVLIGGAVLFTEFNSTLHSDLRGTLQNKLMTFMNHEAVQDHFNGTVLVDDNGKTIFQQGYGWSDVNARIPNQTDTEYRIASLTKSFTAVSILQLEEAGKLKTSDSLSKYFPSFQNGDKITIHDLLTHSSGVADHEEITDITKPITMPTFIAFMSKQKLAFAPGSKYSYSDTGYMILAGIIEKISGESYGQYYRDHIFKIAGMNHTYLRKADVQNMAVGYTNTHEVDMTENESQLAGAGDIISTVGDMKKYLDAINNDKLLTPTEEKKMETGYINSARWGVFKYGYGWNVANNFISFGKPLIEHSGNLPGFKSEVADFTKDRLSVIILSNNNGSWSTGVLARELASICLGKRFWFFQKDF